MKKLLILITLVLISCGSTKNKQSSSSIIDTTSTTKSKVVVNLVTKKDVIDTTSITKKNTISISNNILTDESSITVKPIDPKKPTSVTDSKGNTYTVTNGSIDITNKHKEDHSKSTNISDTAIQSKHTDLTKTNSKSSNITKKETKGKITNTASSKYKRNWSYFPLFLILLVGIVFYFRSYIVKLWTVIRLFIFKV